MTGLRVTYTREDLGDLLSDDKVLAVLDYRNGNATVSNDERHLNVGLRLITEDQPQAECFEVWRTDRPVQFWRRGHVAVAWSDAISLLHISVHVDEFSGMREAARFAYRELLTYAASGRHAWPLKIWHHVPGINEGEADQEHYRQFCIGRAEAMPDAIGEQPSMPAATAIGSPAEHGVLQVFCLAGDRPGLRIENPRQVNAWRYPRQYGPRAPIFSRGTIFSNNGERQFLLSGTASVVGHETLHCDDIVAQTRETVTNLDSLLEEVARVTGGPAPDFDHNSVLKVYVRHPHHRQPIARILNDRVSDQTPIIYLQADICRADLLVEIDGLLTLPA